MKDALKPNGELVTVNGHKIHVYRDGSKDAPAILFMSGHCTVAPVYDFKILYEKLLPDFRVIVVEKFGYGYSDIYQSPCDIDTLVSIQRQALTALGETGPYILAPHSMSGLEAIRWKQRFPDEVSGIIGIDMATPLSFSCWTEKQVQKTVRLMKVLRGLRLAGLLSSVSTLSLTEDEIRQHKRLKKRNAFNPCCINEAREVLGNAGIVRDAGSIECPTLLFSSNGEGQEKDWIEYQKEFARHMGAKLILYDCGHYIHHGKSDEMREEIIGFIRDLNAARQAEEKRKAGKENGGETMDKQEQIKRIERMEEKLNAALAAVRALEQAIADYRDRLEDIRALEDYLSSPEWRADFEADEAGLLPPDLRRGVLSEDGISHLLEENDEVRSALRELAENPERPF